jgi:hypothetical protein
MNSIILRFNSMAICHWSESSCFLGVLGPIRGESSEGDTICKECCLSALALAPVETEESCCR